MALEGYSVRRISYHDAMAIVVRHHYLHRKAPCSVAFALHDPSGAIVGVVCYGTPSSAPLRRGICGPEHAHDVCELTRLWVHDGVPRNGESFLIGRTVRESGKSIVVSFADTAAGHVGTVYQATNWIYTGLSAKRTDWTVRGVSLHGQTLADKFTAHEMRERFGNDFSLRERSRKHRYVWFNGDKRQRLELRASLRYPVLPYPKVKVVL
jgi:hypothetical protein